MDSSCEHLRGYSGEIEFFLVHCEASGGLYAVPVEEIKGNRGYLRVQPTRNGQHERVRWARDYELPG